MTSEMHQETDLRQMTENRDVNARAACQEKSVSYENMYSSLVRNNVSIAVLREPSSM